jgi:hypothetical protein
MPKSNLNLVKTTMRVPYKLWETFKLVAEDQGTCPADLLRSLILEAVRKSPPRRGFDPVVQAALLTAEEASEFRELCNQAKANPRRQMLNVLSQMRNRVNGED